MMGSCPCGCHDCSPDGEYFTAVEAALKIGNKIRSKCEFSGVPARTTGTVISQYTYLNGDVGLDIRWDLPDRKYPLIDGFSKREFEEFLVEVDA